MHRNAEKCRETQRNAEKCSEMHKNAAVLHHILGAIADHWCLGVIAIFHLRVGITAVHHMLSLGVMAVLAGVKLGLPYLRVVVEILGDKAIEWFLDMIITNSNDIIVNMIFKI